MFRLMQDRVECAGTILVVLLHTCSSLEFQINLMYSHVQHVMCFISSKALLCVCILRHSSLASVEVLKFVLTCHRFARLRLAILS